MSEIINNREYRQKVLKELIMELHQGKAVEDVKERFAKLIEGIAPSEISEMEQSLIAEGMPVSEVQRLCDVHAEVFKGSIEEIHGLKGPEKTPGHPINTFYLENRALEKLIDEDISKNLDKMDLSKLKENIKKLSLIDNHYARKENLIFPYMEKYDITAPPKVMWGVDDEIRDALKEIKSMLTSKDVINDELKERINATTHRIKEMIFKEENIMFPMVVDVFTIDEWSKIESSSEEIGYTLVKPSAKWIPDPDNLKVISPDDLENGSKGMVKFDAGYMMPEEINAVMNTIPLDMTFVDAKGRVQFFSNGKERIFPRPLTIIGREVKNCHPPQSVHVVEKIVEDLQSGKKDNEDFWIKMGDKLVYIRYFAVRNKKGEFLGTLEATQNITTIQELEGEKRLMSED
jgi:uncharacterized protein